jgi:hypothetical protein
MSGGRDLNPRPSPWKGDVLPLNYRRNQFIRTFGKETFPACQQAGTTELPPPASIIFILP